MSTEYTPAIQAVFDKQIKSARDVKGNLIRTTPRSWADHLILVFDDGSWAYYRATGGGYDSGAEIEFEDEQPDVEDLLSVSLVTAEEYDEQRRLTDQKRVVEERELELAQLARLRGKYPDA